jgi:HEPN domain-containing protein
VPPATQHVQFAEAARRHLADALLLHGENRFANADHLAGVAAECGLKAILLDHLGGVVVNGMPTHPAKPTNHK